MTDLLCKGLSYSGEGMQKEKHKCVDKKLKDTKIGGLKICAAGTKAFSSTWNALYVSASCLP